MPRDDWTASSHHGLENPHPAGVELSLTEAFTSPFQAEPRHQAQQTNTKQNQARRLRNRCNIVSRAKIEVTADGVPDPQDRQIVAYEVDGQAAIVEGIRDFRNTSTGKRAVGEDHFPVQRARRGLVLVSYSLRFDLCNSSMGCIVLVLQSAEQDRTKLWIV